MCVHHSTPIDFEYLDTLIDGDSELAATLCTHFEKTLQRCTDTLEATTPSITWQQTAHELKGAALAIGAIKLAALCAQEEKSPSMRINAVQTLRQSGVQALEFLRQHYRITPP